MTQYFAELAHIEDRSNIHTLLPSLHKVPDLITSSSSTLSTKSTKHNKQISRRVHWNPKVVQKPETTRLDTNNNSISRILPPQVQDEASDLLPLILVPGYSHYNLASCSISESTSNTIFENGHGRSSNCFPHNVVRSFSSDSLEAASGDEITSFTALRWANFRKAAARCVLTSYDK